MRIRRYGRPELVVDQYLGTAEQPMVALLDYPGGD